MATVHGMVIQREGSGRKITLRIKGAIVGGPRGDQLVRLVRRLLGRRVKALTVDLGGVRMLDCGGIGHLVACRETALQQGVAWRLVGARGPVRKMLTLSDLMTDQGPDQRQAQRHHSFPGRDAPLTLPA